MRSRRIQQMTVLGYPIERVEDYDRLGIVGTPRYEVLCPWSGAVLRNVARLRQATRHVLALELAGLHRRLRRRLQPLC